MTGNKSRIVIQDRDMHLLREASVLRVFDRELAKTVAGFKSTTRANCRLLALTSAGLFRRFFQGTTAGGKKALYALSPAGARLVNVPFRGPRRSPNELLVADAFVAHQLLINEIYCLLKYKPIPVPHTTLLRWSAFYEPLQSGISLIPDGYFELLTGVKPLAAFLEVDLGHEGGPVWKAKIKVYLDYAISGHFAERFRQNQFRVLVLANSDARMHWLRRIVSGLTEKVFWFSTFDSLKNSGFWSSVWLRPKGDQRQPLL
jgi:hypothetical protein